MIEIKNLSKIYSKSNHKVVALKNINLSIAKGDIYGIIGLSGAGKSSLIRCINRLEEPTDGDIWINGVNIVKLENKELRTARKNISMIFQNFNLFSSKTVFENIAFPLRLIKTPNSIIKEKVNELLKLVELTDKANVYPAQLSGGQKQRVGIARSLASDPDVLLCDEATSALDPKTTKQILSLLKNINEKLGLTIVIITHEMEVIKEICNRVAILEDGCIVEEGPTLDVFTSPESYVTRNLINQDQLLPNEYLKGKVLTLSFTEKSVGEPIISRIVKKFNVEINILYGKIEYIQHKPIGKLTVQINVNDDVLKNIILFSEKNHVQVEVLNQ